MFTLNLTTYICKTKVKNVIIRVIYIFVDQITFFNISPHCSNYTETISTKSTLNWLCTRIFMSKSLEAIIQAAHNGLDIYTSSFTVAACAMCQFQCALIHSLRNRDGNWYQNLFGQPSGVWCFIQCRVSNQSTYTYIVRCNVWSVELLSQIICKSAVVFVHRF